VISVGLSICEYGGYVVVAPDGELDVSDAASVADALTSVVARDARIIVDLAAPEFIDCRALGALGRVRAQARQAGGDLLLAARAGAAHRGPDRPDRCLLRPRQRGGRRADHTAAGSPGPRRPAVPGLAVGPVQLSWC